MAINKIKVLSTRPIDVQLLAEAREHNILIDEMSFIHTEFCRDADITTRIRQLSGEKINAVFTSMTAVEAVKQSIYGKPSWLIWCIGNTTKKLVAGTFSSKNIVATADNSQQLASEIIIAAPKNVIFFCGDKRRNELPETLNKAGIRVEELVVYRTTGEAHTLTMEYDGILFFSPSAVVSFFSTNTLPPKTIIFVIGTTTAESVREYTKNPLIISAIHGKIDLVRQVIKHFNNSKNVTCSD